MGKASRQKCESFIEKIKVKIKRRVCCGKATLILKDDNRAIDEPKVLFIQTNLHFGTLQAGQTVYRHFYCQITWWQISMVHSVGEYIHLDLSATFSFCSCMIIKPSKSQGDIGLGFLSCLFLNCFCCVLPFFGEALGIVVASKWFSWSVTMFRQDYFCLFFPWV